MFKSKCISFIGAALLAGSAFAVQLPDCPELSQIKVRGMDFAEEIESNVYISYTMDEYSTPFNWAFIVGPLFETSGAKALHSATAILNALHVPGVAEVDEGEVICMYDTGTESNFAIAVLDNAQLSPQHYKSLLKKMR